MVVNGAVVKGTRPSVGENGKASGKGKANGELGVDELENKKLNGHRPRVAGDLAAQDGKRGKERSKSKEGEDAAPNELSGLAKLIELGVAARAGADNDAALREVWPELPEAAASQIRSLQAQVSEGHAVIRALVEQCLKERDAKEAADRHDKDRRR